MTDSQVSFAFVFALGILVAALVAAARRPLPIVLLVAAVAVGSGAAGFLFAQARGAAPADETLRAGANTPDGAAAQTIVTEVAVPRMTEGAPADVVIAVDQFVSTTGAPASASRELAVSAGAGIMVAGWGYDVRDKTPCRALLAIVDSRRAYRLRYGMARGDVAAAFHDPARAPTGYQGVFGAGLTRGSHAVRFACLESGDRAEAAPIQYSVVVR